MSPQVAPLDRRSDLCLSVGREAVLRLDRRFDVLLQGHPFCDLTFTFADRETLPILGQEVYAGNFAINPGGIFNISAALTRLDLTVGVVTQLGNDIFSRFIAERMEEHGISRDLTSRIDAPLPVVTAGISFPHDRLFISYGPPTDGVPAAPRITEQILDRYRPRVLFTHGEVGIDICRAARQRNILVHLDTNWNLEFLHSTSLRELLAEVDVFSPNLAEALEITGADDAENALELLSAWCPCVAIKCGPRGALASSHGQVYRVPAIDVQAIETTGAGDNFNAGLIYGLLQGYSFERSLECATITGGLSTLVIGGSGGNYTTADLERWNSTMAARDKTDTD
jgi:sugar/nucleoside kinase (ribokinase family)